MKWITRVALSWIAACGCAENEKFFYDSTSSALNIWLGREAVVSDSITYNFAYQKEFDSITFYVRLTGIPGDVDRAFSLVPTGGDSSRVHYQTREYILRAGEYQASFPIYISKPEGYSEFKEKSGHVVFKVKENPFFKEGAEETSRLYIVFKNNVGKPENWDSATYPYRPLSTYFGTYSDTKYSFIIQVTGKSNFKIYYTLVQNPQLAEDEITTLEATNMKNMCKIALLEYNAAHGDLVDENGEKVVFP
jgi:hypothetical protein